ncbi:MAG TPA: RNA polymerase sigma factor [Bryobacteraceae bacterium]|nr:RNA polymerase sigma factor [Bryobacteraceae bacterium]
MADRLSSRVESEASTREFGAWMASEQKRIFLLCKRMLQDIGEADSATQDTFIKAWQSLNRPGSADLENPGSWLTRIAVNTCLDRLRSRRWQFWRKRPAAQDEETILRLAPAPEPNAEDQIFAAEIGDRVQNALDKLSLRQRAVFALRHYEDRSLADIAGILDLDIGTVKVHLFRAIEKLREELHDLYFRGKQ